MPEADGSSPRPTAEAALGKLFDDEAGLLAARRRIALGSGEGEPAAAAGAGLQDLPRVGLAISGGGVRSATFGLGLLRGLAQGRVLERVDYLSTVSGGGFVGAMFGRLVAALGIAGAQRTLASSASPALDWLRRNGRYLTPAGARDVSVAAVTFLRAILAVHGESLFTMLPLLLVVPLPHLLLEAAQGAGLDAEGWQDWRTPWWPAALALWLLAAPGTMAGFWTAREHSAPPLRDAVLLALLGLATLAASALAWPGWAALARGEGEALSVAAAMLVAWSCTLGLAYAQWRLRSSPESRGVAVARLRDRLTQALRAATLAAAALAAIGALDTASWWLLEVMQSGETWIWGGVGLGGLGVIVMRALAQPLQQLAEKATGGAGAAWGPKLLHLAGVAGMLVLLLAWLVLVQWLVFAPEPLAALRDYGADVRALGLFVFGAAWWLLTARNAHMPNASSLHGFYRARLTRAYLAVGNRARGLAGGPAVAGAENVREVIKGDDLDLADYRPEAGGGPIHLINACLNQTRDDASGLYNADRKGTLVTLSPRAVEIGPHDAVAAPADAGTLGRWVAVSGAAASPGAGSYTSTGWSLLLFFLGVRLGYWMPAPKRPAGGWPALTHRLWTAAVKPLMLWSEVSASFYGTARPWWYLSDGGHFDNTGVYALLKRRLDFIILADGSADAGYSFADVENLVRKARIDFGAEIEFYTRDEAARMLGGGGGDAITVLAPEAMADNHSARGVLLARVRYAADEPGGARREGTLLVVKPNLHDALDLDLLAYAQRHPSFPHESTGDQSFDEAQWESYHRLGEDFGRALTQPWLARLPGWSGPAHHPMTIAARLHGTAQAPQDAPAEPLWRRSARATAIGATLGLSASGTLLLGLWQISEQLRQDSAAEQAETQRLFTEVSRDLRDLDGACPKVADHTAVQLMLLRDLRRSPRLRPLEREGVDQLFAHVREECQQQPAASLECAEAARRAAAGICAVVDKPLTQGTALSYWHATPARITLAGLLGLGAADVIVASAPAHKTTEVQGSDKPGAGQAAPPPPLTTRGGDEATGATPPTAPAAVEARPPPPAAASCGQGDHRVQLYVQIYDEASRPAASTVVRDLQSEFGDALAIAPIEDVTRAAQLRGSRRPAPWPQPTLVVHNPVDKTCAADIAARVRAALPAIPGRDPSVWVRDLPRSLKPQPGVIELWIPPREGGSATGGS